MGIQEIGKTPFRISHSVTILATGSISNFHEESYVAITRIELASVETSLCPSDYASNTNSSKPTSRHFAICTACLFPS